MLRLLWPAPCSTLTNSRSTSLPARKSAASPIKLSLGDYQTRPFFDGKFINTFSYPPAGRSLNVLVGLLTELAASQKIDLPDPWAYFSQAASKVDHTDLQVDLNFFSSSGGDCGRISNIRGDNLTIGHLFRAALTNMADSYHTCAVRLWPEKEWEALLLSGGLACKLEVLRSAIQTRFETRYRVAPFSEDTLFGLLILACVFSGEAASVEEISRELRSQM